MLFLCNRRTDGILKFVVTTHEVRPKVFRRRLCCPVTICKGNNRPLDPREGFKIVMSREHKAWQEYDYISLEAILEREGFEDRNIKPHPSEKERIDIIKKSL